MNLSQAPTGAPEAHMTPADEQGYAALAADPHATAADLQAFARQRGFDVTDQDAAAFIASRARSGGQVGSTVTYTVTAPDGASYEVEAPAGASEDEVLARAQSFAAANLTPNSAIQNVSATAQEALDGVLPGSGRFMAGVGGAIGNTIAAPLSSKVDWDPIGAFKSEQDRSDTTKAEFEREHPNLSTAAWSAGLAGSLFLSQARLVHGSGILTGVGNAGLNGAGYGALSGALNDTGDGRLANAALGSTFGGILGAVAPIALGHAADTVATARRNLPGVNGALTAMGNAGRRLIGREAVPATAQAYAQAERLIGRAMDGGTIDTGMGAGTVPLSPDAVTEEVLRRQALGVPAVPADVAEPLRGALTAAARRGEGRMATRARAAVDARQAQQGARVRGHLADELGPTVDPIQEAETISRRASAAADPEYRRAYAQGNPMVIDEELQGITRRPAFQRALPQAYENIQNRGGNPEALGFFVGPHGITLSPQPNFEAFDQVVRTLGKGIKRSELTGRPILDNESGAINDVMMDLDGYLKRSNGAYADAKGNFADEMAVKDALDRGQAVSSLTGDEIASQLRIMPQHAQEAWMAGARTALANDATTAALRPNVNVAQRARQALGLSGAGLAASLGDQRKLQAIETMSGRPGVIGRLDGRLEAEDQAYRTFRDLALAGHEDSTGGGVLSAAGHALGVARKASQGRVLGALSDVVLKANAKGTAAFRQHLNDRTAELLTAADPQAVRRAMGAVNSRRLSDQARQGALSSAATTLSRPGILQAAGQSADPVPIDDDTDPYGWAP